MSFLQVAKSFLKIFTSHKLLRVSKSHDKKILDWYMFKKFLRIFFKNSYQALTSTPFAGSQKIRSVMPRSETKDVFHAYINDKIIDKTLQRVLWLWKQQIQAEIKIQ